MSLEACGVVSSSLVKPRFFSHFVPSLKNWAKFLSNDESVQKILFSIFEGI